MAVHSEERKGHPLPKAAEALPAWQQEARTALASQQEAVPEAAEGAPASQQEVAAATGVALGSQQEAAAIQPERI